MYMYEGPVTWKLNMLVVKKNTSTEDVCNKNTCNNTDIKYKKLGK